MALSAFRAFAAAAREGRYPDLADPHDLWRILFVITSRKATSYLRKEAAGKRGAGAVRGDSGFGVRTDDHAGIDGVVGAEPTPEFLSEALEQYHRLLDALEGPLRDIAVLRAEGFTVAEIADRLGTARRTVERRLTMIRVRLVEMVGDDGGGAADPVAL